MICENMRENVICENMREKIYRSPDRWQYVLRSKLVRDFKNKHVTPSYRECLLRKNNKTMNVSELWGNKKLPRIYIRNCVAMNLLRSSDFEYHRPVLMNVGQTFICVMLVFGHISHTRTPICTENNLKRDACTIRTD